MFAQLRCASCCDASADDCPRFEQYVIKWPKSPGSYEAIAVKCDVLGTNARPARINSLVDGCALKSPGRQENRKG